MPRRGVGGTAAVFVGAVWLSTCLLRGRREKDEHCFSNYVIYCFLPALSTHLFVLQQLPEDSSEDEEHRDVEAEGKGKEGKKQAGSKEKEGKKQSQKEEREEEEEEDEEGEEEEGEGLSDEEDDDTPLIFGVDVNAARYVDSEKEVPEEQVRTRGEQPFTSRSCHRLHMWPT